MISLPPCCKQEQGGKLSIWMVPAKPWQENPQSSEPNMTEQYVNRNWAHSKSCMIKREIPIPCFFFVLIHRDIFLLWGCVVCTSFYSTTAASAASAAASTAFSTAASAGSSTAFSAGGSAGSSAFSASAGCSASAGASLSFWASSAFSGSAGASSAASSTFCFFAGGSACASSSRSCFPKTCSSALIFQKNSRNWFKLFDL